MRQGRTHFNIGSGLIDNAARCSAGASSRCSAGSASRDLGHLSYRVFKDSLVFPFALSLIGLGVIWLGVLWQRREAEWLAKLRGYLPKELRELVEARE